MKIDGRQIAENLFEDLKSRVGELEKKGITPCLGVILVGEDPASKVYVLQKKLKGENIDAKVEVFTYPNTATIEEILDKISLLNKSIKTHGIIVQRPLPEHINPAVVESEIANDKDVDGFKPESPFQVPIVMAVVRILEEVYKNILLLPTAPRNDSFRSWIKSQNIVLLGKGDAAGKPILEYFNEIGAQLILIDSRTENPQEITMNADIIISSVGKIGLIKPDQIKKGVILVSVGIDRGEDEKLQGDYNEEEIKNVASFYTPTPGGVGPVNVAMLLSNLVTAAEISI